MDEGAMNNLYDSVGIIEEIKDYDNQLRELQAQAILLLKDIEGTDTNTKVSAKFLDVKGYMKQLKDKEARDTAMFERLSITEPALQAFSMIDPKGSEYKAHSDNSENMILDLCPSESLLLIDTFKNIIMNRKNTLMQKLQDIYPLAIPMDLK